jgi:hypothetical protein
MLSWTYYSEADLREFDGRVSRAATWAAMFNYVSDSVRQRGHERPYADGELMRRRAVTVPTLVTSNVPQNLPLHLRQAEIAHRGLRLRGEGVMPLPVFEELNKARTGDGMLLANRGGALRSWDSAVVAARQSLLPTGFWAAARGHFLH